MPTNVLLIAAFVCMLLGAFVNKSLLDVSLVLWALGGIGLAVRGVAKRNLARLDEAAAGGDPMAMRGRALAWKLQGNFDEAERLLRAAADAGDVESMWEMGRLVEHRDGLDASEPWFRMAAERGHAAARGFFEPGHALNLDGGNPL